MITAMDDAVGNIVGALTEKGLFENSVIIWMSDNGGPIKTGATVGEGYYNSGTASNWPLRGSKGSIFEGGMRTPAIVHSPSGLLASMAEYNGLFHISDWYPTLLSLAGLQLNQNLDGKDQLQQLKDPNTESSPRQDMVYNIAYNPRDPDDTVPTAAFRRGDWKYILRQTSFSGWSSCPPEACSNTSSVYPDNNDLYHQLFNLALDPSETQNLADQEPELAEELRLLLEEYIADHHNQFYPPADPASNPDNYDGVWSDGWC